MTDKEHAKHQAERLYSFYKDLVIREQKLSNIDIKNDISEFIKDCSRVVCNKIIEHFYNQDVHVAYWYDVRKQIEEIKEE